MSIPAAAPARAERGIAHEWRWLSAVALLALVLRLIRLGSFSYWQDEVHNLIKAEHWIDVLGGEYVSNHPPLFTILLALWQSVGFGGNEFANRLLPALLGVCGVLAIYWAGKQVFDPPTGLWAAFLLAISPFHIHHSQDLKVYILLPFTGTLAVGFLYLAMRDNRTRLWAAYAVAAAIACYSELFAAPLLIAVNLWAMLQLPYKKDRVAGWFAANIAGAVAFLPQLGVMLTKVEAIAIDINAADWWIPPPSLLSFAFYMKAVAFGYSDQEPLFKIALLAYCGAAGAGVLLALKRNRIGALLLLFWFAGSLCVITALSFAFKSFFLYRAMLPFAIPFYLMAAVGLSRLRGRPVQALAVAGTACLAAWPLTEQYLGQYPNREHPHRPGIHIPLPYREAAHFVTANWQEGDIVVHTGMPSWIPFYVYGFAQRPQFAVASGGEYITHVKEITPPTTTNPSFTSWFPQEVESAVSGQRRVWCVFSDWERAFLEGNSMRVWSWLDTHFRETLHRDFGGFEVFLYENDSNRSESGTVRRDNNDGVRVELTYDAGTSRTYEKYRPDVGLVPTPVDMRQGNLRLQFVEDSQQEKHDPANRAQDPALAFTIENRSAREARVRIQILESDYLLSVASLHEQEPESDVWIMGPAHHQDLDAPTYEVPTAEARGFETEAGTLYGSLPLPAGAYVITLYATGLANPPDGEGLDLSLLVGGQDILEGFQGTATNPWVLEWQFTAPIRVHDATHPVPIRLTARKKANGTGTQRAEVAYVAFRRIPESKWLPPFGTRSEQVTIAPHDTAIRPARTAPSTRRVDIWVYESGPDGRAYHIYQILPRSSVVAAQRPKTSDR